MRWKALTDKLAARAADCALVDHGRSYTYGELLMRRDAWRSELSAKGVTPGQVVALQADYGFEGISLFLALLENRNVVAMIPLPATELLPYLEDGQAEHMFVLKDGGVRHQALGREVTHPMLISLRQTGDAGFVIFSSGSTGKPKAILHKLENFLTKFDRADKMFRTLTFLLFDHIAGLDTLFYGLASGGALVLPEKRDAHYVCGLIQDHRVEVLPTSPSFLRLLCLSGEAQSYDLSSLKIVTYGSEPMDQGTLTRVKELLPNARIIQKYGMSELGSPQSKSKGDDSLWMKMDSTGFRTKVVDGLLWIKAESAMIGYLNAPSPFDADGWLCTGDSVEVDGEWMRILGRKSELIIVGGEKVYPQEVEAAILEIDGIQDAVVRGEKHPMMGQIVTALVNLAPGKDGSQILKEVRAHCRKRLAPYKVPVKVEVSAEPLTTSRQKKQRASGAAQA